MIAKLFKQEIDRIDTQKPQKDSMSMDRLLAVSTQIILTDKLFQFIQQNVKRLIKK